MNRTAIALLAGCLLTGTAGLGQQTSTTQTNPTQNKDIPKQAPGDNNPDWRRNRILSRMNPPVSLRALPRGNGTRAREQTGRARREPPAPKPLPRKSDRRRGSREPATFSPSNVSVKAGARFIYLDEEP